MRKLLQVVFGAALCVAAVAGLIYSPLPLFWEHEDQPRVYSLTWRSDVVMLALIFVT